MSDIKGVPEGMRVERVERGAGGIIPTHCYLAVLVPDNVYGKPLEEVEVPKGYRYKGGSLNYRPTSSREEMYIGRWGTGACSGGSEGSGAPHRIILEPIPQPKKVRLERWANCYKHGLVGDGYKSLEAADTFATTARLACVSYVIEYEEPGE